MTDIQICELCEGKYHGIEFHPCQFCPYVDHTTEEHPCDFCKEKGHIKIFHFRCNLCDLPDHNTDEHKCSFCKGTGHLQSSHYKCSLCKHPNHTTEEHKCQLCKGIGHKPEYYCKICVTGYKGCKCINKSIIKYCEGRPFCIECHQTTHLVQSHPCEVCIAPGCNKYKHHCQKCGVYGHDTINHPCDTCHIAGHLEQIYCPYSGRIDHPESCISNSDIHCHSHHKFFCGNITLGYCSWCQTSGHTKETHICDHRECGKIGYHFEHSPGFDVDKEQIERILLRHLTKDPIGIIFYYYE